MGWKTFKDYLSDRQLRESEEAIKVDKPISAATNRIAGNAVAKTVGALDVDLKSKDPRIKNQVLSKSLAKAQDYGANDVSLKTIANKINPEMKI